MKIVKVNPSKASSLIELTEKYWNPNYRLIIVKYDDNECFKWADQKNPQRITRKLKDEAQKLNFTNIEFPMAVYKIYIFEKNYQIAINVYSLKGIGYHINYPVFANFRLFLFYTQDEAVCV